MLAEYRHQAQAQFQLLVEQVKARDDNLEMMIVGIQPVLDYVGLEHPKRARLPGDKPYRSVVDHCRTAWVDFKEFAHSATHGAVVHVLTQLRSHYPLVNLWWVVTRYMQGMDVEKIARLEDDAEEPMKRLAKDIELFGEGGSSAP